MDYVIVQLDKPRRLRFDINSVSDAEDVLDRPLGVIMANLRIISTRDFRAVVWAGLKWEDAGLTVVRVGELIQAYCESGEIGDLRDLVDRAMTRSGVFGRPERLETEQAARAAARAVPPLDPPPADGASPTS